MENAIRMTQLFCYRCNTSVFTAFFLKPILWGMKVLHGIGITENIAFGKAYVYRHGSCEVSHYLIEECAIESEIGSFHEAVDGLIEKLSSLKCSDNESKAIVEVQKSMLSDPELEKAVSDKIRSSRYNAAWAVESVIDQYISMLTSGSSEYFAERAIDLKDIRDRIISRLSGAEISLELKSPSIIVADYLVPSELLNLPLDLIKGIALKYSGKTSHVAILAHAASIPAVFSISSIDDIRNDDSIIIDGLHGELIVDPDADVISSARISAARIAEEKERLHRLTAVPARTVDGREIKLYANVGDEDGIDCALSEGADGIGLFRSEILYMNKEYTDDDIKMSDVYRDAAYKFRNIGPVTIRTFDVGGDKTVNDVGKDEENPFLGLRSIRYCLNNRDFFRKQLIAILRASEYRNIRIMFPMVTGVEELEAALDFFESIKDELRASGEAFDENIKVGTMIEVPSAALTSRAIAGKVDFMSIGTNDLIQYTIAVDRGNEKVSYLYQPLHPAHLSLLKMVLDNAGKAGVEVSICGEMAGDPEYIPLLIGMGFCKLSMAPSSILEAKSMIMGLSWQKARALADRVLAYDNIADIKKELKEFSNGEA